MPFSEWPCSSSTWPPHRVDADEKGYITDAEGQPILPPGMKEHLKADLNRTIEDF